MLKVFRVCLHLVSAASKSPKTAGYWFPTKALYCALLTHVYSCWVYAELRDARERKTAQTAPCWLLSTLLPIQLLIHSTMTGSTCPTKKIWKPCFRQRCNTSVLSMGWDTEWSSLTRSWRWRSSGGWQTGERGGTSDTVAQWGRMAHCVLPKINETYSSCCWINVTCWFKSSKLFLNLT